MGKYLMGLFFVIIVAALCWTLWTGSVAQQKKFGDDVKQDIGEIYLDPKTSTIPNP